MSKVIYQFKEDDAASRGWSTTRSCAWALLIACVAYWAVYLVI